MVSGVYCFKHKEEPFIYIGSSNDIQGRYDSHISLFNKHLHSNRSLMSDYLDDKLDFTILNDYIPMESLKSVEHHYCKKYLKMGYLLYNKILPKPKDSDDTMLCSKKVYESSIDSHQILELQKEISRLTNANNKFKETINDLKQKNWELQIQMYSLNYKLNEMEYVANVLGDSK